MTDDAKYAQAPDDAGLPVGSGDKKKRKGSLGWRIVFWAALIVCVGALAVLGVIAWSYWEADHRYRELADTALVTAPEQVNAANEPVATTLGDMEVDWDYLRSINGDVIGWIYMPGTPINYPVCFTDNNQTYLDTDFNGNTDITTRSGTVFLDCNNKPDLTDTNNVFYGHHMQDGTMFACLSSQLASNDEFNAHRVVYLLTPDMNYKLEPFALILTTGTDLLVETNFQDTEARVAYIKDKMERSVVTPAEGMPDPAAISQLFTMSTCDYTQENGRAVMFTRVLDKAAPHSVTSGNEIAEEDAAAVENAAKEEAA